MHSFVHIRFVILLNQKSRLSDADGYSVNECE